MWPRALLLMLVVDQLVVMGSGRITPRASSLEAAQSVNSLGFKLLKVYRKNNPEGNVVFSPITISTAFALIHAGAMGATREELNAVFGFDKGMLIPLLIKKMRDGNGRTATTSYAGKAFINDGIRIKESYIAAVGADRVENCAFSSDPEGAKNVINEYVAGATDGLITEVIDDAGAIASAELAIITAIHFKGLWEVEFAKDLTEKLVFHSADGAHRMVHFMAHAQEAWLPIRYNGGLDSTVVEVPYKGGIFSMVLVIPSQPDGWRHAEQRLCDEGPEMLLLHKLSNQSVILRMPKFEMEFEMDGMEGLLQELGVRSAFTTNADLSGITDAPLLISDVVHKAKIRVDEEGTEAAAVTGIFTSKIQGPDPIVVTADRPFLYIILDKRDGTVLFQGTVTTL